MPAKTDDGRAQPSLKAGHSLCVRTQPERVSHPRIQARVLAVVGVMAAGNSSWALLPANKAPAAFAEPGSIYAAPLAGLTGTGIANRRTTPNLVGSAGRYDERSGRYGTGRRAARVLLPADQLMARANIGAHCMNGMVAADHLADSDAYQLYHFDPFFS